MQKYSKCSNEDEEYTGFLTLKNLIQAFHRATGLRGLWSAFSGQISTVVHCKKLGKRKMSSEHTVSYYFGLVLKILTHTTGSAYMRLIWSAIIKGDDTRQLKNPNQI